MHSAEALLAQIEAKDAEISRLIATNNLLIEKIFSLAAPKLNKPVGEIKRPMVIDPKSGTLREKTEAEASAEYKALQELGILA